MVDRIIDINGDESAIGIKNVTFNEPQFTGHFPGNPVFPGVLLIEGMAQTAGAICVLAQLVSDGARQVYFLTIDKAKFRKPVVPGDLLRMPVKKLRQRGPVWKFEGKAFVGDDLCAEAEFTAMIHDGSSG